MGIQVKAHRRGKAIVKTHSRRKRGDTKTLNKGSRLLKRINMALTKEHGKLAHQWAPSARKSSLLRRAEIVRKVVNAAYKRKQVRSW